MSEDDLEWEDNPGNIPFHVHMIAGSFAGLCEHITIFPIDTLKTHLQCERCGAISPLTTWNCASKLVKNEGIMRLWRGVTAMFAGCIPAHAMYFSIFEFMKVRLGMNNDTHQPLRAAFAGASASFGHDIFMTPFDVIKQRMQLGYYKNMIHCTQTILKYEGIKAFYRSFPTTLIMNIPYGCIMVAVNESARKILNPSNTKYNITSSMLAGSIAGSIAAVLTNPLDVIKTRLQTQNLQPCPKVVSTPIVPFMAHASVTVATTTNTPIMNSINATNTITNNSSSTNTQTATHTLKNGYQVAKEIIKNEGFIGFIRGATPRLLVHAPAVAVSWTAYETVKTVLSFE